MDKANVTHILSEVYSVIMKNEIMSFAGKWMEVEIITLREIRVRKTNATHFLSYAESGSKKTIK
jgi:hypothetical protein